MRLPETTITPTIVFDLDGTLVHTVPDIAAALDVALKPYEAAPTSAAEAATMMGDGLSEFFWRALVAKRLNLPAMQADAARKRFIEVYGSFAGPPVGGVPWHPRASAGAARPRRAHGGVYEQDRVDLLDILSSSRCAAFSTPSSGPATTGP